MKMGKKMFGDLEYEPALLFAKINIAPLYLHYLQDAGSEGDALERAVKDLHRLWKAAEEFSHHAESD
jgi:hypothetical protein